MSLEDMYLESGISPCSSALSSLLLFYTEWLQLP